MSNSGNAAASSSIRWWICEGPLPEANRFLGPFETRELALTVRSYVERADARWRGNLWVDKEEGA